MSEMRQKYYSITEASAIMGISKALLLDFCHARGQRFGFQPSGKNGKWLIDLVKLDDFLQRRTLR